jgi:hypothetical protein
MKALAFNTTNQSEASGFDLVRFSRNKETVDRSHRFLKANFANNDGLEVEVFENQACRFPDYGNK